MNRIKHFELLLVTSALLGGCTMHASFKAGSTVNSGSETGTSPSYASTSGPGHASSSGHASKPHSEPAREVAVREQDLTTQARADEPKPASPAPAVSTAKPAAPVTPPQVAPAKPSATPAKVAAADHDRGHGNDADRVDEDNPGKSKGNKATSASAGEQKPAKVAAKKPDGDHDKGHGNDADRVDEDNPGKSKKLASGK